MASPDPQPVTSPIPSILCTLSSMMSCALQVFGILYIINFFKSGNKMKGGLFSDTE